MRLPGFRTEWRRSGTADAVVTGAGSGIGRAFALELARRGGRVVCSDIDEVSAKQTAEMIGERAISRICDVADLSAVETLADAAEDWFSKPADIIVNNAGIGAGGVVIGEIPIELWRKTIDVNLWGVVHGCHVFAPRMRAAGRGGIINVASAASFGAAPRMAAYNVSKAGVLVLSETLAAELSGTGVAVTVLCPTFVKTNILKTSIASTDAIDDVSVRLATTAMKWSGVSPDSVADAALDALDRGRLHAVPQLDAKVIWQIKRLAPATYTRTLGVMERIAR